MIEVTLMSSLYDALTKKEKEMIRITSYKKETTIFHEDDFCDVICIILEGLIDILSYSFSGKEIVYNNLKEGDVFGNNLIFSDKPYFRGNVISKEKTKLAIIHKNTLIKLLKENESFLIEYLRIQSNFGKSLNARIKLLGLDNAEDRFMYYMYLNKGSITFKNITSLSQILGLARETLSRLISRLIKENKIIRNKNNIKLVK